MPNKTTNTLETHLAHPRTAAEEQVAALGPWFHNLHLPDGTQTAPEHPLGDFPAFKWQQLGPHLPKDLSGWRALDIGCNAGFYAFELARRGAAVTAIDVDERYLKQARWAAGRYGLEDAIAFRPMQVYDLARESEAYDLVLFLGVFYHLRYPLLALDLVAEKTKRLLAFQTLTMPGDEASSSYDGDAPGEEAAPPHDLPFGERAALQRPGWPKMAFIEKRLAGDPTNWWAPNAAAVEAMLRSSGLRVTARPGHEMYLCAPDAEAAQREGRPFIEAQREAATGQARGA